jgi:hypothetical protein
MSTPTIKTKQKIPKNPELNFNPNHEPILKFWPNPDQSQNVNPAGLKRTTCIMTCNLTCDSTCDSVPALACDAPEQGNLLHWRANACTESQVESQVMTQVDTALKTHYKCLESGEEKSGHQRVGRTLPVFSTVYVVSSGGLQLFVVLTNCANILG